LVLLFRRLVDLKEQGFCTRRTWKVDVLTFKRLKLRYALESTLFEDFSYILVACHLLIITCTV
jgi:hypothetical protein